MSDPQSGGRCPIWRLTIALAVIVAGCSETERWDARDTGRTSPPPESATEQRATRDTRATTQPAWGVDPISAPASVPASQRHPRSWYLQQARLNYVADMLEQGGDLPMNPKEFRDFVKFASEQYDRDRDFAMRRQAAQDLEKYRAADLFAPRPSEEPPPGYSEFWDSKEFAPVSRREYILNRILTLPPDARLSSRDMIDLSNQFHADYEAYVRNYQALRQAQAATQPAETPEP